MAREWSIFGWDCHHCGCLSGGMPQWHFQLRHPLSSAPWTGHFHWPTRPCPSGQACLYPTMWGHTEQVQPWKCLTNHQTNTFSIWLLCIFSFTIQTSSMVATQQLATEAQVQVRIMLLVLPLFYRGPNFSVISDFPSLHTPYASPVCKLTFLHFSRNPNPPLQLLNHSTHFFSCIKGKEACYWENRSWEYIVTFRVTFHLFFISSFHLPTSWWANSCRRIFMLVILQSLLADFSQSWKCCSYILYLHSECRLQHIWRLSLPPSSYHRH